MADKRSSGKFLGFTLIEVLITITIMGILSTLGISTFQSTQKKSRDLNRKAGLTAVTKALANYMTDKGVYPPSSPDKSGKILWCGTADDPESQSCQWGDPLVDPSSQDDEKTVYMSSLPKEPVSSQNYFYEAVTMDEKVKGYRLYGRLENSNDPDKSGPYGTLEDGVKCRTEGDTTCNYILTSETVAPPPSCLVSGSACQGVTDTTCCSPNSCSVFYGYTFLLGYTDSCIERYFCGNPNPTTYTATKGKDNGEPCDNRKQCCSDACTTFYTASGACSSAKFCGTTPPAGYATTDRKTDGQSCTLASQCCSNACTGFYRDANGDGVGDNCTLVLFCGTTPPSGYVTTCCKPNGQSCTLAQECCGGTCCGSVCGSGTCNTYYADADSDTYPNQSSTRQGFTAPSRYIVARADGLWDCCDTNNLVYPNNPNFYTSPVAGACAGMGFDYNCNGIIEPDYPVVDTSKTFCYMEGPICYKQKEKYFSYTACGTMPEDCDPRWRPNFCESGHCGTEWPNCYGGGCLVKSCRVKSCR